MRQPHISKLNPGFKPRPAWRSLGRLNRNWRFSKAESYKEARALAPDTSIPVR